MITTFDHHGLLDCDFFCAARQAEELNEDRERLDIIERKRQEREQEREMRRSRRHATKGEESERRRSWLVEATTVLFPTSGRYVVLCINVGGQVLPVLKVHFVLKHLSLGRSDALIFPSMTWYSGPFF